MTGQRVDLSADMNGDLAIGQADVDTVVRTVLGTEYGDANLDGDVDVFEFGGGGDFQILNSNLGRTGSVGWADGDFNGDDDVDVFQFDGDGDFQLLNGNLGFNAGGSSALTVTEAAASSVAEPSALFAAESSLAQGTAAGTYDITTGEITFELGANIAVIGIEALAGELLPENLTGELAATQATSTVIAFSDIGGLEVGVFDIGNIIPVGTAVTDLGFGFAEVGGPFIQSTLTVIPEPTAAAVLGLGGLTLLRRRRNG